HRGAPGPRPFQRRGGGARSSNRPRSPRETRRRRRAHGRPRARPRRHVPPGRFSDRSARRTAPRARASPPMRTTCSEHSASLPCCRVAIYRFRMPVMIFLPISYMVQPASASLEQSVIDVLKNVSRRPIEPTMDSDLVADLGFDSLQVLELVAELEDRFDVSIPLNDVPSTRTVAQIVAQVARLVGERPTASWADCGRCRTRLPTPRAGML